MPTCPACHAECVKMPVLTVSDRVAAQHFVLAEEFPERHEALRLHVRSLWGGDTCDLLSCGRCHLRFAWPFVAGDATFYNLAYPHADYPRERWEFVETVDALRKCPPEKGRVLEIGAGFGHFLRLVSPGLIKKDRVVAVEYSDAARQRLVMQGFHALGEDVRAPAFNAMQGELAAVFMFQVLEHMDRLDELVTRLNELTRPGASVFVAVPNAHRIEFNELHGSLLDMPPNHISRWTKESFQALAERANWTLVDFRTQPMQWKQFVRMDIVYSHLRRAQVSGSLANRLRSHRRTRYRVAAESALAAAASPLRIAAWIDAARDRESLGDSVWAHFRTRASA